MLTVITPTTGKPALNDLIASVDGQTIAGKLFHFLLWDNVRDPAARPPADYVGERRLNLVLPAGAGRNGEAPGSALRAVGLMAAMTPWVTFADDDVRWEPGHAEALLRAADGRQWAATLRNVWSPDGEYLGVDRFESVGDDPGRTVPYVVFGRVTEGLDVIMKIGSVKTDGRDKPLSPVTIKKVTIERAK